MFYGSVTAPYCSTRSVKRKEIKSESVRQEKMASGFSEEDFTCPVCCDIFNDPVLLHCSHSVCKVCLEKFWKTKGSRECPVCRSISPVGCPPLNMALRSLCETFLQNTSQKSVICDLHGEKFKLFCLDDEQLVCVVCQTSKMHKNHKFSPVDEAATDCKDRIKKALKPLQEKLKLFKDCELAWTQTAQHIKSQALNTEKQIKEEFGKLHQFLHDEEAIRISALRTEEEQKSQTMKKKIERLSRDIELLSDSIREKQNEMSLDDVTFLQMTVKRSQLTVQNPEEPSGALIHVAEHLSNLKFNVWEKMQNIVQYTPITLDPNTAHPFLLLSDDLTSIRYSDQRQKLPDNPERFNEIVFILGSELFDSGTHCWDVEIGDSTRWIVGVMSESAERKDDILLGSGLWFMCFFDGEYGVCSSAEEDILSVTENLRRIRVKLDWDRGTLSFINPLTNVNIHMITHRFTDKLRPLFGLGTDLYPLQVLPLRK